MKNKTFALVIVSMLAIGLFAGCANITDQIAKSVAETAVNQATGGKVNIDNQNGSVTFKDKDGNTAQMGAGTTRPASAPADMPSLPNARNFAWVGTATTGALTFMVSSTDNNATCDQMVALVKAQGWGETADGYNAEFAGLKTIAYVKPGFLMALTCAASTDGQETNVMLSKNKSGDDASDSMDAPGNMMPN